MEEVWKQISIDLNYQVSNLGRIRSMPRKIKSCKSSRSSEHIRSYPGKILKPFISKKTGYLQVNLSKKSRVNVHRIVAAAFCAGWKPGLVVNHLNGIKDDNRSENLEWCTYGENTAHSFRELGRKAVSEDVYGAMHPASKGVISTCLATGVHKFYGSGMDAVREGFSSSQISRCCKGISKSHKGKSWRYA